MGAADSSPARASSYLEVGRNPPPPSARLQEKIPADVEEKLGRLRKGDLSSLPERELLCCASAPVGEGRQLSPLGSLSRSVSAGPGAQQLPNATWAGITRRQGHPRGLSFVFRVHSCKDCPLTKQEGREPLPLRVPHSEDRATHVPDSPPRNSFVFFSLRLENQCPGYHPPGPQNHSNNTWYLW